VKASGRLDLRWWFRLFAALSLALLGGTKAASAQSGYFYLDRIQVAGAPDDGITVFRPYVRPGNRLFANLGLGYSHNPLRKDVVTDDPTVADSIDNPVKGQLILYPAFGGQLGGLLTASVSLPVAAYTFTGDDPHSRGVGTGGLTDQRVAVHDLRLDARLRTFESDTGAVRFALGAAAWNETGNTNALAGDGQMSGWLYAAAEFDFEDFFVSGHIGPHFRPDNSIGGAAANLFVGSELRWAFGLFLPMREGRTRLGAELFGTTGLDGSAGPEGKSTFLSGQNTALEWMGQLRLALDDKDTTYLNTGGGTRLSTGYGAPDFRVLIAIGTTLLLDPQREERRKVTIVPDAGDYDPDTDRDGYPDAVDQCVTLPEDHKGDKPSDGCPENVDRDRDGIPDRLDQCPTDPEDKDGLKDEDGCPEEDVDGDGIPDTSDKCPTEAGERSTDPALHGCPRPDKDNDGILNKQDACPDDPGPRSEDPEKNGCPTLTRVVEGRVELLRAIEFQTGKAVILKESFPILDEVVTLMVARPELRLGLYGHTDDRGRPAMNLDLSKRRAAACVKYLVDHGIQANRLESEGFGQTEPIGDNLTAEGRAKNRRVEFKILGE
jgi:outer membrane protein OmpA-like peptidoglycan-associated protein